MLLTDRDIRWYCLGTPEIGTLPADKPMLEPFSEGVQGDEIISYGLTSAGYDLRLGNEIWSFHNRSRLSINPKRFKDPEYRRKMFDIFEGLPDGPFTIPPNGYILGRSHEYIRIPRNIKGRCVGKSTYARCGIIINTTPLEPGWEGHLTIEISNATLCHAEIFVGEGIAQLEFETLASEVQTDYAQKEGKYQGHTGVNPAKVL